MNRILFFTAPWCQNCNILKKTFALTEHPATDSIELISADDSNNRELLIKYNVRSLPVVVKVAPEGQVLATLSDRSLLGCKEFLEGFEGI